MSDLTFFNKLRDITPGRIRAAQKSEEWLLLTCNIKLETTSWDRNICQPPQHSPVKATTSHSSSHSLGNNDP